MNCNERTLKVYLLLIFGIICIIAGIFKWPFPSIMPWWRKTKYGEILNTIVMILFGIWIVIGAIDFLFLT